MEDQGATASPRASDEEMGVAVAWKRGGYWHGRTFRLSPAAYADPGAREVARRYVSQPGGETFEGTYRQCSDFLSRKERENLKTRDGTLLF